MANFDGIFSVKKWSYIISHSLHSKISQIIHILKENVDLVPQTMTAGIKKKYGKDPYLVLISCLLSLRTKDTVTLPASIRLFEQAKTPQEMLEVPISTIEKLIYPVGFYRKKARLLHAVSKDLINRFESKVPSTEEELLSINGVGRKTANLVLGEGFGIPAICVDTHVHRVSNRLGIITTKTPMETEIELKKIIPEKDWIIFNQLLVGWGQSICVPISPFCSKCPLNKVCKKVGVTKSR